jgi:DNA-binding MarR family transcriptional regulator
MGLNRRIRDTSVLLERALDAELAPHRITMSQMRILLALSEHEHLTQRAIAASVNTTESTILVTLRLMVKRGLVARTQSTDDWRKREIRMTPKGAALHAKVRGLMRTILAISFEGMRPAEIHTLITAFEKISGNIRKHYRFSP